MRIEDFWSSFSPEHGLSVKLSKNSIRRSSANVKIKNIRVFPHHPTTYENDLLNKIRSPYKRQRWVYKSSEH